jgi:hypothetical protein
MQLVMPQNQPPGNNTGWAVAIALMGLIVAMIVALYGDNLLGRGEAPSAFPSGEGRPPSVNETVQSTVPPSPQAPPTDVPIIYPSNGTLLDFEGFMTFMDGQWNVETRHDDDTHLTISQCSPEALRAVSRVANFVTILGPNVQERLRVVEYRNETLRLRRVDAPDDDDVVISREAHDDLSVNYGVSYLYGGDPVIERLQRCRDGVTLPQAAPPIH